MKQPRMAISCVTAYAAVASPTLREVIVHQLAEERDRNPDLSCWTDPRVKEVLSHPSADPKTLPTPPDPFGDGLTHGFGDGVTSGLGVGLPQTQGDVSGSVSTPPTPAPTPAPHSSTPPTSDTYSTSPEPDDGWGE